MEKIEVAIIVDGQEKGRIQMGSPQKSGVYKDELTWYVSQSIAPYVVTARVTRRGDLVSPVTSKELPPPTEDTQASLV